jgi:molybdopterin converting factor small subunit
VWIPSLLRDLTGGETTVQADGVTVRQVIESLEARFPGIKARLVDGDRLRPALTVSVDGEVTRYGLRAPVKESSEVHFLPAVSGGSLPTGLAGAVEGEVGHGGVFLAAVPVERAGWDVEHVPRRHVALLLFGSDDAAAFRDDQHPMEGVRVPFGLSAGIERHFRNNVLFVLIQRLSGHPPDKDATIGRHSGTRLTPHILHRSNPFLRG